jgi:NTP pyrophosphatase (non-canonical NTP hydrolase)
MRPIDADALIEKIRFREGPAMGQREIFLVEGEPTLSLNTLRDAIYEDAVAHGLWDDMDDLIGAQVSVVVSEVRELIDAAVDLSVAKDRGEDLEKYRKHFIEELADVVISSLSLAGKQEVDIDAAVRGKMEINKERPWRHEEKANGSHPD